MILKLHDYTGWRYFETKDFKIHLYPYGEIITPSAYDTIIFPLDEELVKERIKNEKPNAWLLLDNGEYYLCPNGLHGYVISEKGQTIDKIDFD